VVFCLVLNGILSPCSKLDFSVGTCLFEVFGWQLCFSSKKNVCCQFACFWTNFQLVPGILCFAFYFHELCLCGFHIQVSFGANTRRTSIGWGSSPRWDETLYLPFIPPGDSFTPTNLQQVREEIHFSVFDEVVVRSAVDDRAKNSRIERKERRWLGSVSIPFATVYMNNCRVEGHFQVGYYFCFEPFA